MLSRKPFRFGIARIPMAILPFLVIVFIGLLVGILNVSNDAQALRVTMKRIIFEGSKRTETITIINNKPDAVTYRMGWRHYKMTEDKSLVSVSEKNMDDNMKTVSRMVRFAPRRVTVPGGGSQQIRLMLRRPRDLVEGEYRSHFWITPEAQVQKFSAGDAPSKGESAVQLSLLTGISLPVFVRHGNLTASGNITDAKLSPSDPKMSLTLTLNREGNRSLYGDFDFTCLFEGKETVVHQVRGIAVYHEVTKRFIKFSLPYPEAGASACPQLRVEYRADRTDSLFKGQTIAETVVSMGK